MRISIKNGFSLIEVLITLSLIGVATGALLALMTNMNKYLKSADSKSTEMVLISDLSQVVSDKDQCKKAITTSGPQFINLNAPLKLTASMPGGSNLVEGSTFQNSIVLKEFYVDSFEAPVATAISGQLKTVGNLWLQTVDKSSPGVPRKKKNIGLLNIIYKSSNMEIVECFSSGVSPNTHCTSLGFLWNSSTQTCRQPASTSCSDLGGTWDGTKCVMPDTVKLSNILGKTCGGSNQALIGYDANGNPQCVTIAVAAPPVVSGPPVVVTPPNVPNPATCAGGNYTMKSNDGTNTCVFTWTSATAGNSINCSMGASCSSGGGNVYATCQSNGNWNYTFSCPDKGGGTCVGGVASGVKSTDGTNSCDFVWPMTSDGQTIVPTKATNGGTLVGSCLKGVPTYSYNCPGKAVTCPAGAITVGKCYFTYGSGSPGGAPSYLYDLNGKGTASNIICGSTGVWNTSKVVISGCN